MSDTRGIKAGRAYVEIGVGDKLTAGLKRAQARLKAFGAGMTSWGTKMLGIGTAIAAPLVGAGKVFGDFEKQMKMVSTMLDEPEKHMDAFTSGIRTLSVQFGEGTDVLAKGLYDLLSASVAPSQAMDVLGVAVKSAKGGMTDTAVAVDGLTSVLNAFQMSAGEAGHVADVMFQTVKRGKLTFPDLASNIGKLAPMARAAGMSMEDMMAGVATMTRQGLNAEEATTRMVNIIKQAPEEARKMGDLAAKYVGKSLSEIQVDFPEIRAAGGIAALSADIEGFRKDLGLMQNAAGQADVAFGKMTGGLSGEFKKVQMAAVDVAVSIGQALAPTLKSASQWIVKIAVSAGEWIKQNQSLIVTIFKVATGVAAAGVAMMVAGKAVSLFGSLLGVAATVLPLLISPIGLVITAVGALGAYMLTSTEAGGKALDWLGGKFSTLQSEASDSYQGIADALAAGDIGLAAKVLWTTLKMWWTKGVTWLSAIWNDGMLWLKDTFAQAWGGLRSIFSTVAYGLRVAWVETTAFLSDTWTSFVNGVLTAWHWVGKQLTHAWNWLKSLWDDGFDAEAANASADAAYEATKKRIDGEAAARKKAIEDQRVIEREAEATAYDSTLRDIAFETQARRQALQKEHDEKIKTAEAGLDAARKEWQEARGAAKQARKTKETGGPGSLKGPDELLKRIGDAAAGLGDAVKASVSGTFNASALFGMGAGTAAERTAKATEQTAKNTKKLLDTVDFGGSAFV